MHIRLAFAGRNYHVAAGLPTRLTLAEGADLDAALAAVRAALAPEQGLPDTCLVAVSGVHLGTLRAHQSRVLQANDELLIVAPVAGG